MQRQFQQFVEFQLHADLGTHSANCAADRGDLTSTVLWWLLPCLLLCKGRCSGGSRVKTVESLQLQCLWASSSSWTRLLCPWCNEWLVRQWIHLLRQFKEGFMDDFPIFLGEG